MQNEGGPPEQRFGVATFLKMLAVPFSPFSSLLFSMDPDSVDRVIYLNPRV